MIEAPPVRAGLARVLESLRTLTADGWPASVREIAAHAGVASSGQAHEALHELGSLGLAEQHPRNAKLGWRAC